MAGKNEAAATSPLEWVAAILGALIALALLGLIAWDAATGPRRVPPALVVQPEQVVRNAGGYVVRFVARNRTDDTAAGVQVEGVLKQGGTEVERSQATIDYVPGNGHRRGGLIFTRDPAAHSLELRATGYQQP